MKKIIFVCAVLFSASVIAQSQQTADLQSKSDASNTGVNMGNGSKSETYVFPAPVQAANLPASNGCVLSKSWSASGGWNAISATSSEQNRAAVCDLIDEVNTFTKNCQFLSAASVMRSYLVKKHKEDDNVLVPDIPEGTKNLPVQDCFKVSEPKVIERIIEKPVTVEKIVPVEKIITRNNISLAGDVNFDSGKDTLTTGGKIRLDKFIQEHKGYKNISMTIQGHTDNKGTWKSNKDLSERRALTVKNYILSQIDGNVSSEGFSFDKPIATNASESGRAMNRRVEISFVGEN